MARFAPYRLLLILAAAVFLLDQATKLWIESAIEYGSFFPPDAIEVVPGFFHLVHVGNTGAAWSLFAEHTEILAAIGFVALALIYFARESGFTDQGIDVFAGHLGLYKYRWK